MSKADGQPSTDSLSRVVDLIVEHSVKLEALEHVLKETNPPVHDFYLGTLESLRSQKALELKKVLNRGLTEKAEVDNSVV